MNIHVITAFQALAHETRLSVFRLLVTEGPDGLAAGKIALRLKIPTSTLSTHLSKLEQAGLIRSSREQQKILYAINPEGIQDLIQFFIKDCCGGKPEICGYLPKTHSSHKKATYR